MLSDALARMPHSGPMQLIAAIESADAGRIRCHAVDHAGANYPLRLDGVLYTATLVELGAQAAAAHASIYAFGAAHTGLVLSIAGVKLHGNTVADPAPLRIDAERLRGLDGAAAYRFTVGQPGPLAAGEVLLSMRTAGR